MTSEFCCI